MDGMGGLSPRCPTPKAPPAESLTADTWDVALAKTPNIRSTGPCLLAAMRPRPAVVRARRLVGRRHRLNASVLPSDRLPVVRVNAVGLPLLMDPLHTGDRRIVCPAGHGKPCPLPPS